MTEADVAALRALLTNSIAWTDEDVAPLLDEIERLRAEVATLSMSNGILGRAHETAERRLAEARNALSAMVLEHDAGGITLATMREARTIIGVDYAG
jgi:predicted  nucleic acid-binding Zn-ribbon protein